MMMTSNTGCAVLYCSIWMCSVHYHFHKWCSNMPSVATHQLPYLGGMLKMCFLAPFNLDTQSNACPWTQHELQHGVWFALHGLHFRIFRVHFNVVDSHRKSSIMLMFSGHEAEPKVASTVLPKLIAAVCNIKCTDINTCSVKLFWRFHGFKFHSAEMYLLWNSVSQ